MIGAATLGLALSLVTTPEGLAGRPAGTVTILDARPAREYRRGHVPGAIRIDWKAFREGRGRTGKLPADLGRVATELAALGVDSNRAVVVYGDARQGWGEEGRIVWMLTYLGHPHVSLLDGGWAAWLAAKQPASDARERPLPGNFIAKPVAGLRASADASPRRCSRGGTSSSTYGQTRNGRERRPTLKPAVGTFQALSTSNGRSSSMSGVGWTAMERKPASRPSASSPQIE
jgi:rhodanese-related sulfurtransferase